MEEILCKSFPQNCGDILKVIEKVGSLYKCEFINYKYEILAKRQNILKGSVLNPQIEIEEFVKKEHLQNCGDYLVILEKTNLKTKNSNKYLWKCKFKKYPCEILAEKGNILKGSINNPQIEQIEFVEKIHKQKYGDSLKIIEKTNIIENRNALWRCEFQKYPSIVLARKDQIIRGEVDNPKFPWKEKDILENFIKNNFCKKVTLVDLSKKLKINYSTIGQAIEKFELRDYILYDESIKENNLFNYLSELNINLIQGYFPKENKFEIDIFCKEKNFGIEYNGSYWHSELFKESSYHQKKSLYFKNKNINILHIFEYELEDPFKRNILLSILKTKCNIFEKKIFARKCQIKEISNKEYISFCENNHLQGYSVASIRLGLFFENKLIQVLSFSKARFVKNIQYECIRECSKLGYFVLGGKEKLWKYFVKNYNPESVISYCDFSKFTGDSYLKLGFKKERLNKPGFVWYDKNKRKVFWRSPHKHQEMKDKYIKIYDCGQLVFVWNKNYNNDYKIK